MRTAQITTQILLALILVLGASLSSSVSPILTNLEIEDCTPDQVHIALGNAYYYSMPGTTPIEGEDNYDMSITFHTEVPFHPPLLISAGGVCWYVRSYFRR